LAERTFKRRFVAATGLTPIAYVQRLRIEDAKRRLERTDASVDEISQRSSGVCSGARPACRRALIASAFASRSSRGPDSVRAPGARSEIHLDAQLERVIRCVPVEAFEQSEPDRQLGVRP